jgi:hypothetical protein
VYEWSINWVIDPNPVYSHSYMWRGLCLWRLWWVSPSFPVAWFCGSLIRCQSVQVYYHHPSFCRCWKSYLEWPVLLHLRLVLCVQPLLSLQRGLTPPQCLHSVQSPIFRSPMENSAARFATSSPNVRLTVLLNAILLSRRSCFFKSRSLVTLLPSRRVRCLLSSGRPLGAPLATLSLHGS